MRRQRVQPAEVVDYIHAHLDEQLSLARLSRAAHLSKYHFQRKFTAGVGIGPIEAVRLLRLKHASFRLAFARSQTITSIAFDAGFANSESFSRAFRNAFGQSPREFARRPAWELWRSRFRFLKRVRKPMSPVEIVTFPTTKVAAIEHRGSPANVYDTSRKFIEWRRTNGVSAAGGAYGVHYDDRVEGAEDNRIDICAAFDGEVAPNPQGVVGKVIPGGRCARMRHLGSREHIECAEYLYRQWLPAHGAKLRDFPIFFHYVNVGPNVRDHEMITDVYLPIE